METTIQLYSDGGSRIKNNKKGGSIKKTDPSAWAFYVKGPQIEYQEAKAFYGYTNNQMELAGFISALKYLKSQNLQKEKISCYLDSKYVLQGITQWLPNWIKNNYRASSGKPIKNPEYWQALAALLKEFPHLNYQWVKGHDDTAGNILVDELLNTAMDNLR